MNDTNILNHLSTVISRAHLDNKVKVVGSVMLPDVKRTELDHEQFVSNVTTLHSIKTTAIAIKVLNILRLANPKCTRTATYYAGLLKKKPTMCITVIDDSARPVAERAAYTILIG